MTKRASNLPREVAPSSSTPGERPGADDSRSERDSVRAALAQADRELHERAQQEAAIAAFGRRAIAQVDLAHLMDDAASLVAQTLRVPFAAISELNGNGAELLFKSLKFAVDTPSEERKRVDRSVVDHIGSFAGHAIRTGQPVTLSQTDGETRFDVSLLRSFGVASAAAVPLKLLDRPYGVLAAYGFAPREFSREDVHFLEAIAYVLSVFIERKLVEEAVRRERDFAESLVQTAQVVVLVLDTHGKIVRINPYTAERTGFQAGEVQGADWVNALLPVRNRALGREMFDSAASGKRTCNMTYAILAKDGVEREIDWSGRALTDENGAVVGVLFIGHDITELRKAQKRLLETERLAAIGQMVAGLAHESRNALQQIGACAEMLAMELENSPQALDLVTGVQEAEARLVRLFDDMRAYALPPRLDRRVASVAHLWRKAWSELTAARGERGAQLREVLETDDLECQVATARIQLAFCNVLENALEACSDPVIVTIRCSEALLDERAALSISIRDNGPGLTPSQRARVLEPFYTTKTQGTGLGMPIVQSIVQAHAGRLEVPESSPGAEFRITLPRQALPVQE